MCDASPMAGCTGTERAAPCFFLKFFFLLLTVPFFFLFPFLSFLHPLPSIHHHPTHTHTPSQITSSASSCCTFVPFSPTLLLVIYPQHPSPVLFLL
ncbi:MAG: hypothetical protein J3R72DRAFT_203883 [Linnemannia gamsii]|nr:MAG: hypothetical protein J3R72DRAFT_203883 [Linnemannia gamsii]